MSLGVCEGVNLQCQSEPVEFEHLLSTRIIAQGNSPRSLGRAQAEPLGENGWK